MLFTSGYKEKVSRSSPASGTITVTSWWKSSIRRALSSVYSYVSLSLFHLLFQKRFSLVCSFHCYAPLFPQFYRYSTLNLPQRLVLPAATMPPLSSVKSLHDMKSTPPLSSLYRLYPTTSDTCLATVAAITVASDG